MRVTVVLNMKKPIRTFLTVLKQLFIPFAGMALLFSSCSKNGSGSGYHLTCTIDGTDTTFNESNFAQVEYGAGKKSITINGVSSTAGSLGFIITNFPGGDSITIGTYRDTGTRFEPLASYTPNIANTNYEAGTSFYKEASHEGFVLTNHFTVTFTEITPTTVRGAFSGDFYLNGDARGIKKTISNGDFYVSIY